jgi:hypothetical protein
VGTGASGRDARIGRPGCGLIYAVDGNDGSHRPLKDRLPPVVDGARTSHELAPESPGLQAGIWEPTLKFASKRERGATKAKVLRSSCGFTHPVVPGTRAWTRHIGELVMDQPKIWTRRHHCVAARGPYWGQVRFRSYSRTPGAPKAVYGPAIDARAPSPQLSARQPAQNSDQSTIDN